MRDSKKPHIDYFPNYDVSRALGPLATLTGQLCWWCMCVCVCVQVSSMMQADWKFDSDTLVIPPRVGRLACESADRRPGVDSHAVSSLGVMHAAGPGRRAERARLPPGGGGCQVDGDNVPLYVLRRTARFPLSP